MSSACYVCLCDLCFKRNKKDGITATLAKDSQAGLSLCKHARSPTRTWMNVRRLGRKMPKKCIKCFILEIHVYVLGLWIEQRSFHYCRMCIVVLIQLLAFDSSGRGPVD